MKGQGFGDCFCSTAISATGTHPSIMLNRAIHRCNAMDICGHAKLNTATTVQTPQRDITNALAQCGHCVNFTVKLYMVFICDSIELDQMVRNDFEKAKVNYC